MKSEPSDSAADIATSAADIATEVELSAEDLLGMALSAPLDQATQSVVSPVIAARAAEFVSEEAQPPPRERSVLFSKSLSPKIVAAVSVGVIAIAGTVIAAQYKASAPPNRTSTFTRTSFAAPVRVEEPEPEIVDERPPVLFKNPFDATEVFEFPPGTSKDDALAAVADLLMKRAMERQTR